MKKKIQHIKKNVFLQVIVKMNKVVCFGLDFEGIREEEKCWKWLRELYL